MIGVNDGDFIEGRFLAGCGKSTSQVSLLRTEVDGEQACHQRVTKSDDDYLGHLPTRLVPSALDGAFPQSSSLSVVIRYQYQEPTKESRPMQLW